MDSGKEGIDGKDGIDETDEKLTAADSLLVEIINREAVFFCCKHGYTHGRDHGGFPLHGGFSAHPS